ncbi:MAG: aminopeptidase P family N-terminal domain-containing protein, partial [Chromatocurvus sp.]
MDKPVDAVRGELRRRDYAAVIVPRADEHLGEYIPQHRERLRWLTGFTGSAGCAVVLREASAAGGAALFVDGRYTVQVRRQVDTGDFAICHLTRDPPEAWLRAQLDRGDRVAVDPRLHTQAWYTRIEAALAETGIELVADADNLVDLCWHDRPPAQREQALLLAA